MKRKLILCFLLCIWCLVGCGSNGDENESIESAQGSNLNTETESETEEVKVYTEEEYKALCQVVYYDDVFEKELEVGKYVKIHGFISGKGSYSYSDMFGIIIDDIRKEYDLEKKYVSSCVLHEEKTDYNMPTYVGESVYLLFDKENSLSPDDLESGEKVIIYGEVVQNWSGVFIIPKYIEAEK